ncbi:hypothetical protein TREMEDRAFT_70320 [Tremella mesenterica DSM 1558]|nr:uncharacterized protein TREMEDRAFT_70320 [Tremella mesenterica DSM 1558]EIW66063.1 hypothetical protein TREMEDRAFT_70320 [Tremella mesenterica DSM 1558]
MSTGGTDMPMKMWFHGTIGTDMLWFASWMPTSGGATAGVCIGLFLLGVFERYLMAFRRACDVAWSKGQVGFSSTHSSGRITLPTKPQAVYTRTETENLAPSPSYASIGPASNTTILTVDRQSERDEKDLADVDLEDGSNSHLPRAVRRMGADREGRWSRPFRWGVDVPRGMLQALQTLVHYLLMLAVMSFNIWWVMCIVLGAGVGEALFGRFGSTHTHMEHTH